MDERDWLIIKTLYKYKNITRTAEELFITQPALTSRLKYIEALFGVQIVNRTTKGVQFTVQGAYLADKSRELLNDFIEIKHQVLSLSAKTEGTLNIAASSYITNYRLPKLLKAFKKAYPHIDINVSTAWSKDIFGYVFNRDVHVGFASVADIDTVERSLICEEELCVASMQEVDLHELYQYPRISYQSNYLLRSRIDRWWRENYKQAPQTALSVDSLSNCLEMVRAGLGFAIIPDGAAKDFEGIKLRYIYDQQGEPIKFKVWMLYNKDVMTLNIAKVFIEFLQNKIL